MKMKLGSIALRRRTVRRVPIRCVKLGSAECDRPSKKPLLESWEGRKSKVPKGFLAVYVGPHLRRFVIPVTFLAMPAFKLLLESVAEEYGCDHHADGALHIPCDEDYFLLILNSCSQRHPLRFLSPKKLPNLLPLIPTL